MNPLEDQPIIPGGIKPGPNQSFLSALVFMLSQFLVRVVFRLNRVLPKDGSEAMTGPLELMTYTVATLPAAAAANTGTLAYVSDGAAGGKFQASDGTAWAPIELLTYTIATLPAAAAGNAGNIVYVSDEVAGLNFKASDGAQWGTLGRNTYTVATLPAAAAGNTGSIVYVSDGGSGTKFRGSDGTAWLNIA
jgi:hypothetical protein